MPACLSHDRCTAEKSLGLEFSDFGAEMACPAGATLFRQGDRASSLFLIERGAVLAQASGVAGRKLLVAIYPPGWLLGVQSGVLGCSHAITATALTDCDLRSISVATFQQFRAHQSTAAWLQEMLSAATMAQQRRIIALTDGRCSQRVAQVLADLVVACGERKRDGSVLLRVELTVTDLADLVVASRQWISRLMIQWSRRGIIHRRGGWWVVPSGSPLNRTMYETQTGANGHGIKGTL